MGDWKLAPPVDVKKSLATEILCQAPEHQAGISQDILPDLAHDCTLVTADDNESESGIGVPDNEQFCIRDKDFFALNLRRLPAYL